jgi:hypothetical protein
MKVWWRERPVQEPAGRIDAAENEHEAHRDEPEAEQHIADETRPLEADEIEQADTLVTREPPHQREAAGVDQGPVHRQPWR